MDNFRPKLAEQVETSPKEEAKQEAEIKAPDLARKMTFGLKPPAPLA